jgi:exopolyphosphatase/guanosine-5'-triphosphate,3'-diphosphate pyrophosphatase
VPASVSPRGVLRPAPYACIDIGSNTTRMLVAEVRDVGLRELLQQRAFTRLGREIKRDSAISATKLAEIAAVVATQVRLAEELRVKELRAVATAALRDADNGEQLVEAVRGQAGLDVTILTWEEEARLAFVGATKTLGHPVEGEVAVVDVGGGSSELAVGTAADGVRRSWSFRIGSGLLADAYLRSDPPSVAELHAVREHVAGAFEGVEVQPPELAVAVGGSATSLRRLVGASLEHETLERGVRVLASMPAVEVSRRFELEPERVRLLPAGILILEEISDRLGRPLQIGNGGLREGVILEMVNRDPQPGG